MQLSRLRILHLRCFEDVSLEPSQKLNLIYGLNGAGKTSLLEAIYFLGRGQSFRLGDAKQLIQDGDDACVVRAELRSGENQRTMLAIQKSRSGTQIKVNQEHRNRLSEIARLVPVLVMDPNQHRLLEDGPFMRRRFLDWLLFHVEPQFPNIWSDFNRALQQRNSALKAKQLTTLHHWNALFSKHALKLAELRSRCFDQLHVAIQEDPLLQSLSVSLNLYPGWRRDAELSEILLAQESTDLKRGFTSAGPHRAELRITGQSGLAREALSRGQSKRLVLSLLLAQATCFKRAHGYRPILLVDDIGSELDDQALIEVSTAIQQYSGQVFVTSLRPDALPTSLTNEAAMFHVKHGQVDAMV